MQLPKTAEAFAPAKLNLALHVTGQREDGYHLLDSLVVFAGVGDDIHLSEGSELSLNLQGPRAAEVPVGPENLVLRAANVFGRGAEITLTKRLPVAAGIGGGSTDAAATLRAMATLTGQDLPDLSVQTQLGADVPVCVAGRPARMRGIGDQVLPVPALPPLWMVLVNPGVGVATPQVFRALSRKDNAPIPSLWAGGGDQDAFLSWLSEQRNDLQAPALQIAPVIGEVLGLLQQQSGCALSRMSGSGATCFGLFFDAQSCQAAATAIAQRQPHWWCAAAPVLTGP